MRNELAVQYAAAPVTQDWISRSLVGAQPIYALPIDPPAEKNLVPSYVATDQAGCSAIVPAGELSVEFGRPCGGGR